ncbi:MAG: hypothetical protein LUC45_03285 [Paraprevotella sp.]|nr:hypothetical protein [Paraprevotella sp.]
MKNLNYLWTVLFTSLGLGAGFPSCRDDDDSNVLPKDILDTWILDISRATFRSNGKNVWEEDGKTMSFSFIYDGAIPALMLSADGEAMLWTIISLDEFTMVIEDD